MDPFVNGHLYPPKYYGLFIKYTSYYQTRYAFDKSDWNHLKMAALLDILQLTKAGGTTLATLAMAGVKFHISKPGYIPSKNFN